MAHHVERALAGLLAFQEGCSLSSVEECIRERDFLLEFHDIERVLREHTAFLSAYAVCHDLGKADTCILQALPHTKGAAEGFPPPGHDDRPATDAEKVRYDKLIRAQTVHQHPYAFFEQYGIQAHYPGHARVAATDDYASTRESVLHFFRLSVSHAKMFTELIRLHMEVITTFQRGPDAEKYRALGAIAERLGLNRSLFFDLLTACCFVDTVLGSLGYNKGQEKVDLTLFFNLLRAEREAFPERHQAREEALRRGRKTALRDTLAEAELSPDEVFILLKTPYGPVRGRVMEQIYEAIRNEDAQLSFGEHTEDIRRRAEIARKLLQARDLNL